MSIWRKGYVQWYDESAGEGMILDSKEGLAYYVHSSAIQSKNSQMILRKGMQVTFQIYENLYMRQIEKVRIMPKEKEISQ